jgi:hypothetical protein
MKTSSAVSPHAVATRINARLNPGLAQKVALVQRRTHKGITQIVQESLELYCNATLAQSGSALHILESAGFVGCAEGAVDLSSRYKEELRRSLERKA